MCPGIGWHCAHNPYNINNCVCFAIMEPFLGAKSLNGIVAVIWKLFLPHDECLNLQNNRIFTTWVSQFIRSLLKYWALNNSPLGVVIGESWRMKIDVYYIIRLLYFNVCQRDQCELMFFLYIIYGILIARDVHTDFLCFIDTGLFIQLLYLFDVIKDIFYYLVQVSILRSCIYLL